MPAALLLLSVNSARLRRPQRREEIRQAAVAAMLERTGKPPETLEVDTAEAARLALAEAGARGVDLVVVAGGDGSVRTAAAALAGTRTVLGIVPTGTGNLFAAALRLPRSPMAATRHLPTAQIRDVDVGEAVTGAGRTTFVVACGVGFDAKVMAASDPSAKARFGVAAYFAAALRVARTTRGVPTRITADGQTMEASSIATLVANAGELVPGLVGPRAPIQPDDGLLDLIAITGRTALDGALAGVSLLLEASAPEPGEVRETRGAIRLRAPRIRVETNPEEPVEIDGDVIDEAGGWLDAAVQPGALRVLA